MLVIVPAFCVAELEIATDLLPSTDVIYVLPRPKLPVPAVAVIACPVTKPAVELIPVMIAVYGPDPAIVPTVPVVLTVIVLDVVTTAGSALLILAIWFSYRLTPGKSIV